MSLMVHNRHMDLRDLCRRCREAVTAEAAARYYGLDINRHGKALCPFHNDQRPSLSFKGSFFRCFSCGAHGDSITFTARYLGLRPMEAVRRLNADFGLHLPLDRPQTAQEAAEALRRAEHIEAERMFTAWTERTLNALSAAYRAGHQALKADRELTEAEAYAVRNMVRIEYLIDVLSGEDQAAKYSIFNRRKEVNKLCRIILSMALKPI